MAGGGIGCSSLKTPLRELPSARRKNLYNPGANSGSYKLLLAKKLGDFAQTVAPVCREDLCTGLYECLPQQAHKKGPRDPFAASASGWKTLNGSTVPWWGPCPPVRDTASSPLLCPLPEHLKIGWLDNLSKSNFGPPMQRTPKSLTSELAKSWAAQPEPKCSIFHLSRGFLQGLGGLRAGKKMLV